MKYSIGKWRISGIITIFIFFFSFKVYSEITLPDPLPGNPEYLIRVIYIIPTDRLLDYSSYPSCPQYNEKITKATNRLRIALETIDDFMNWQIMVKYPVPDPPGVRLNFEREDNGKGAIRILVVHGSMNTAGYWGSNPSAEIWHRVVDDILSASKITEKTQKTIFLILPDVTEWDNELIGFQGYIGGGMSLNMASSGWGGISMMSAGFLEFIPEESQESLRLQVLENQLSSEKCQIQAPNPYTGALETWNMTFTLGKNLCTSLGILAHELSHGFGIGHGGRCQPPEACDLMGGGHYLFGHTISQMYGFCDNAYSYDRPVTSTHNNCPQMGEMYSHYLAHSPYLYPQTHPDKTDSIGLISYPVYGSLWDGTLENIFHLKALENSGGSGLDASYFFWGIDLLDFQAFRDCVEANPCQITFFPNPESLNGISPIIPAGLNQIVTVTSDKAGNLNQEKIKLFRMIKNSSVVDNTAYVAPASYSRIPSSQLGSSENPHASIQTAIDAVASSGAGTVFIMDG
ncbi:hypothetical protein JW926_04960, partial [Candidatus Sumerlaeota bacterium]|nr:hypothetical protein [Candidatus Sumerlaeota bacterium]